MSIFCFLTVQHWVKIAIYLFVNLSVIVICILLFAADFFIFGSNGNGFKIQG